MDILTKNKKLKKKKAVRNIKNGCLECEGDLIAHDEIYTLRILGVDLLSIGKRRGHIYVCGECENTFSPSVRYHSFLNDDEKKDQVNSNNDIYARLMVASLAYTANIDDKFSRKEDELLEMVLQEAKEFPSAQGVLKQVLDLGKDARQYVFSIFDFAKQHLSRERLESVIIANARMILVDGKIKKSEQRLLRKYMKAAGLSSSINSILARAHNAQYVGGADATGIQKK